MYKALHDFQCSGILHEGEIVLAFYIYTYIYMYIHIYTYLYMYIYTYTYIHLYKMYKELKDNHLVANALRMMMMMFT
jgi:uncharacterized protein YneF (UPF0154 family)